MRLVGYVRVSTDRQVEQGQGLVVQQKAIRAWAKAHGHRIIATCRDEGVSGTKDTAERHGLAEAVSMVCDGRAQGVVVHRLDRLARTLTVQEAILGHVWQCGGRVFTVDASEVPQDDPDDPMRTFVRQVMGAAAQLEKGMISVRLRQGRQQKAEKGGYAYGAPSFGYRAEERSLVADEDEQRTLARMRELFENGESFRRIAAVLNEEGRPSKRGGTWHPMTVKRALARPPQGAA